MARHKRILIIRPDRIGDVVLATPLIRALRETFPQAHLAAMLRPATEAVLRHNPHLDEILTDDPDRGDAGKTGFRKQVSMLRGHRFDTALMLLPTERHSWMTLLAGIRTRVSVGSKIYQLLTFTRRVSRHKYIPLRHEADYCMDLGRAIGVRSDNLNTEIIVTDREREQAKSTLRSLGMNDHTPLLSVFPESGRSAPNWEAATYLRFVREILTAEQNLQVMVNLTPGNSQLRRKLEDMGLQRLILPQERNGLRKVIALISQADVLVSASTGPMHLAGGLGVRTVSLFCPLTACSPLLWGPKGNSAANVLPPEDYCREQCPGDPHICTLKGGLEPADIIPHVLRQLTS